MHLDILVEEGAKYGLELNWDKTVLLNINTEAELVRPSGDKVKRVDRAVYLGSVLGGLCLSNTRTVKATWRNNRQLQVIGKVVGNMLTSRRTGRSEYMWHVSSPS